MERMVPVPLCVQWMRKNEEHFNGEKAEAAAEGLPTAVDAKQGFFKDFVEDPLADTIATADPTRALPEEPGSKKRMTTSALAAEASEPATEPRTTATEPRTAEEEKASPPPMQAKQNLQEPRTFQGQKRRQSGHSSAHVTQ